MDKENVPEYNGDEDRRANVVDRRLGLTAGGGREDG